MRTIARSCRCSSAPATRGPTARCTTRATSGSPATCSTDRWRTACSRCWRARAADTSTGSATSTGCFPIGWDDGPAWRFDLEIAVDEKHDGLVVDGALRARRRAAGASGSGPAARPRISLHAHVDGAAGARRRLRLAGAPPKRRSDHDPSRCNRPRSLETLARSGLHPRSLPAELRYDVFDGEPRPRVRVNRPERQNPHALPAGSACVGPVRLRRRDRRGSTGRHRLRRRAPASGPAQPGRRADGHRSSAPARVSLHLEPLRVAAGARHLPRSIPARRPHAREGRLARRSGRAARFERADSMRLEVSSGIDWFDLHGTVEFGDGRSAPFPQLLAAIARGEDVVVLGRRQRGPAAGGVAAPLRRHRRVRDGRGGSRSASAARRRRCSTRCWPRSRPSRTTRRSSACASELQTFTGVQRARPAGRRSAARCANTSARRSAGSTFLRRFGFGGCLADDMGLGKTVMVLALLEAPRAAQRTKGDRRAVARRRAAIARVQLDGGGAPLRAEAEGARPHRDRCARSAGVGDDGPGPDDLRHAAPRHRAS